MYLGVYTMKQTRFDIALVFLLTAAVLGTAQQDSCRSESFPPKEQFLLGDDVDRLEPNANMNPSMGHLVIVPEMRFNCHGYITGWSALLSFDFSETAFNGLEHDITFQLWRPSPRDSGIFTFVGSSKIRFVPSLLPEGVTFHGSSKYFNLTSVTPNEGQNLRFQPDDVMGWYFHTKLGIEVPLSVAYRHFTTSNISASDPRLQPVDMYTTIIIDTLRADTPPPCELSLCSDQTFTRIPSVIPYLTVDYVNTTEVPVETQPACVNTSSDMLRPCDVTTPFQFSTSPPLSSTEASPTGDSTVPSPTTDSIFGSLPIIIGVAGGIIAIVTTVAIMIIICLCVRSRTCVLKTANANISYDNPALKTSDTELVNGAVYALPNPTTSMNNGQIQVDPKKLSDIGCYATTYMSNDQLHIYQELTEVNPHKMDLQSSLQVTTPGYPAHPPITPNPSTSTLQKCSPYTLPHSQLNLDRIASSSRQQLSNPSDTLNAAAIQLGNGSSVMRIFHSIEDEGYHVPTHEQRIQFENIDSTEELYSRLNRPHEKRCDSREVNFFEQADLYWEPPSSTAELYNQLAMRKYREIHRDQVHLLAVLGSGHFGAVSRGYWEVPGGRVDVAIKFLKPGFSEEDKTSFLQEAAIMGQFSHHNIVCLHGVVTVGEPLMIVLELMPNGDLKNYLRDLRNKVPNLPPNLPKRLLNFCRQISDGMNYLSNKAFIHRDLAARNILLTQDLTCKIGDFGMTRALSSDDTYQSQGGKIPLKWSAPEALNYRRFTSASDVWSYGIVLFEIWSLGQQPFRRVSDASELMSLVNSGHRQAPPPGCPRALYKLMVKCWHPIHEGRPRFSEICDYLSADDETLLYWSHEDRIVSPSVTHLGAPLSEARNLYPDLQFSYDNESEV